jgi:outer membrane protein insertion porin family
MRKGLIALLLIFVSFFSFGQESRDGQDWYYGKPVKDITWEGLNNVKISELESIGDNFIGRIFDDEMFFDLQERIYGLELFDYITPSALPGDASAQSVILKFTVSEKPIVARIVFEGNIALRRNELLDAILIKPNDVFTSLKALYDESAIKEKYLSKGFTQVQVKSETRTIGDGQLLLVFTISEGEKIAIEGFRFEGNTSFSDRALRRLLSLKAKSLVNDGAFKESALSEDIAAIESYYRERGYVDARVIDVARDANLESEKGLNMLTLVFKIVEGKQYTYRGVSFQGNKIFTDEQLAAKLSLKPGQILNFKRLENDYQAIVDLYYENGYIFNTINRSEERDEIGLSIAYTIMVVERPRAHIENIIIEGNVRTKDHVIMREIPLQEGDIFSKTKVFNALRNLYNLQFFSNVMPETPPGSEENLMDLVFVLEEQPTADIQFGVTFSGTTDVEKSPVSAMVKLGDKNFLGYGNTVGAEVTYSPDLQKISLQYMERWLFGLPLSGSFDLTVSHGTITTPQANKNASFVGDEDYAFPYPYSSWQEYYDASKQVPTEYLMDLDRWTFSLGFSSGYRFDLNAGVLSLGGGLRTAFNNNIYDTSIYRPFDPSIRDGANEWILTNSLTGYASLDNRDIFYDPSKGYYVLQRLSLIGLLPEIEKEKYIRSETKAEGFVTLFNLPVSDKWSWKTVLGLHSGFSCILPAFQNLPIIKSTSKFYIDGMFYGRGWTRLYNVLGLAMWENWLELRTPLVPGILAWDFFLDAVAIKETPEAMFTELRLQDMYFSMGGGLRITIPQFPFRFSLAKRFEFDEAGQISWKKGGIFPDSLGMDFVLSFAISTY